jgi:hypothetical protein
MSTERWFGTYRVLDRAGNWYVLRADGFFIAVFDSKWEAIKHAKMLQTRKRTAGRKGELTTGGMATQNVLGRQETNHG